jgi:outer membrane protein TolC
VGQSFDLPTVLGKRKGVAVQKNQLVDEEYRAQRMGILLEAELVCIDITYYNALAAELDRRLGHARRVVEVEKRRLDSGDTDVLSYNNVLLSLSALEAEKARVVMESDVLMAQLTALNGGKPLSELDINSVEVASLGSADEHQPDGNSQCSILDSQLDFASWYAVAEPYLPQLAQVRQLHEVRRSELALAKTEHLPSLSAAYINERHTIGTRSQGVAVGMSLPLWSNNNRVRSARTALEAAEAQQADTELRLRSEYAQEYARVKGLHHTATLYRRAFNEANNTELLERAMDEGFISVLEYLQGIELYYDYLDRSLAAERDYRRAAAELEAWRL